MPHRPLAQLARDPQFLVALAAGIVVWIGLASVGKVSIATESLALRAPWRYLSLVLLYPLAEELIFRGWLQPTLADRLGLRALAGLSAANFLTSALFAAAHLPFHPAPLAIATFLPSLVFGHFQERYRSVVPGVLLHAFYNAGYFALFA
jgi:uncharacterized protein